MNSDFAQYQNVELITVDTGKLSEEQRAILLRQAEYCQAMTDADTEKMIMQEGITCWKNFMS